MDTTYEQVFNLFFKRIEKDEDFFRYYELTADEALALAKERASTYLEEAIGIIMSKALPQINFNDRDDTKFNFEFNSMEKLLVPSLMYEMYLDRDIAYLKLYEVNFTSSDLKVFSPSDARTSFMTMYKSVKSYNEQLLDDYKNIDRNTGKYKKLDYSKYDKSSEVT